MKCDFYEYRSGFWNGGDYCLIKEDYVDKRTYNSFCDNSLKYRDCPIYRQKTTSSTCYLTTACVFNKGLPDDCDELTTLRSFRDTYLKSLPEGEKEIEEYYKTAPTIVDHINASDNPGKVYDDIYNSVIVPCVELIKNGDNEAAHCKYRDMVTSLMKEFY